MIKAIKISDVVDKIKELSEAMDEIFTGTFVDKDQLMFEVRDGLESLVNKIEKEGIEARKIKAKTFEFFKEMQALADSALGDQGKIAVTSLMVGDEYTVSIDGKEVMRGPYKNVKMQLEDAIDMKDKEEIESMLKEGKSDEEIKKIMSEEEFDDVNILEELTYQIGLAKKKASDFISFPIKDAEVLLKELKRLYE